MAEHRSNKTTKRAAAGLLAGALTCLPACGDRSQTTATEAPPPAATMSVDAQIDALLEAGRGAMALDDKRPRPGAVLAFRAATTSMRRDPRRRDALELIAAGRPSQGFDALAQLADRGSAAAWMELGDLAYFTDLARAEAAYETALTLAPDHPEVLARLADVRRRRGEFELAGALARSALAHPDPGDLARGEAHSVLGEIAFDTGEYLSAEGRHQQALRLFELLGDPEAQAVENTGIGLALMRRGDLDAAEAPLAEAAQIHARLDNPAELSALLITLSTLAHARGDLQNAEDFAANALELYERQGSPLGHVRALSALAAVAVARSDHARAATLYREVRDRREALGDTYGQAAAEADLARALAAQDDVIGACEAFARAHANYSNFPSAERDAADIERQMSTAGCARSP